MDFKKLIEALKQNPGTAEQKMRVRLTKEELFKTTVKAGKHKLIFDEEKAIGGTNEGPAPAQMLLAAIGGCMLSTMQVWSQLLDTKIDTAEVSVTGNLNLYGMTGIDEKVPAGFQKISVDVKLGSSEPEDKIKTLIEAVEKHCPVANTVMRSTKIITNIKS